MMERSDSCSYGDEGDDGMTRGGDGWGSDGRGWCGVRRRVAGFWRRRRIFMERREDGEELGLTIPFEYTTYYAGVGQLSFSQHITCLRVSSYPAPTYQSCQQLCLLVTINAYPSLLLLRSVKVLSPKGSMGIKSILNRGFRKLSIQSQMIVPTSRFFPSANSTEYLMSTVDGTMPLKELNSAEVRLL
ncbi:hypothetical protein Tco_1110399 [Tanacetum coccineum]|uniref:Uncharacterized protein n=1 Tax=Tanacetum coccineum TaxID=301880 RepID=A0ABQ5IJ58_9ASTR